MITPCTLLIRNGEKLDAKEYLQQYRKICMMLENRQEEAEWIEKILHKSSSLQRIRQEAKAEQAKLMRQRANILADIEALPAAEYAVLHCLYVQGLSLQEADDQAGRSYAWAALTHRKALDSLQKVLDERSMNAVNNG